MIKLNKSTRFALYSIVELSRDQDKVMTARQIAGKYKISEHHVAKVLQQLTRAGFVRGIRGVNGGFRMVADPRRVTMLDIVTITEPMLPRSRCVLLEYGENCDLTEACGIGDVLGEIEEQAYYTLKSVTIATLISRPQLS